MFMSIIGKHLILFLGILIFGLKGFSSNHKEILVLNSYHNGLSWTDSIVNSIKQEFSDELSYSVYIEDMDTKRHFSEKYLQTLKKYYQEKYDDKKFDLIISTDNNAYDFLKSYKNEIFDSVPILFCGLNSVITPPKGFSGVFENTSFCSTLHLIENNHPDYKEIVVVTDHSTTGVTVINAFLEDLEHMEKAPRYRILQPVDLHDLQLQLSKLQEGSIILYLLFNRDSKGNYVTYERGFEGVEPYCSVPIYCVWDFYLNKGAIGGALITGRNQGKQVSNLAKKVLSGTPIDDLPPLMAEHEFVFDYKQLSAFDIEISKLPKNAHIINKPYEFVRENKEIVILTLTVLILLTIIIIVMTINIHLRKVRAQKDKVHLQEIKANHENLKLAKESAEESSRLKSAFLANMSHEIRTPMNAILGFTELLSGDDVEKEKRNRFLLIIQKNTKSLLRLISDILDISKIETNQLKILKSKCNLDSLFTTLQENYDTLIEQHEDKELTFSISTPENSSIIEFTTDSIRVHQIFTNLLENSIKFTSLGSINIGYEIVGDKLQFFVKDTGIGIPENKQKIIFDRFRQADLNADTRQYGGTGLGLAISKSLVELLDGEIWMKSEQDKGTTFYFSLPI